MTTNRRHFIKDSILAAGAFFIPTTAGRMANWALNPTQSTGLGMMAPLLIPGQDPHVLTVYHTAHHAGQSPSLNGMQHLMGDRSGLLVDAGHFLSGNESNEHESNEQLIAVMNKAGYHAAAVGDTELDMNPEQLKGLTEQMRFPLVCANIHFDGPQIFSPYITLPYGSYKIGITGVADRPLHAQSPYRYQHPKEALNSVAKELQEQGCNLVICLSSMTHLSDQVRLARSISGVDLIMAANRASFQTGPYIAKDMLDEEVAISQGCANGSYLRHLHLSMQTASVQFPA
jgi:5'-nucleotidase